MTPDEIRFHHGEEFVVIEQFIELGQLRFELQLEFGDQLEEVHGVVSIDYHGGLRSCGLFGHRNPTGPAYFAPQTSTTSLTTGDRQKRPSSSDSWKAKASIWARFCRFSIRTVVISGFIL